MKPRRALLAGLAGVLTVAAAAAGPAAAQGSGSGTASGAGPTSIVQLGDSVAAGEGTLYGYTYDASTREWTGGNVDAVWPGPHPLCHDSPDAYGEHVARTFGASFTQLACTGASFDNGIRAPEVQDGTQYAPAEFGDWESQTDLNERYDAAAPDLVLLTFGADDVHFSGIVQACVENSYEAYFDLADLECVRGNPGDTIRTDYLDLIGSELEANYRTIVEWIGERAQANGVSAPKVVFTTYPDPLPPRGTKCPDTSYLDPRQVRYLATLVTRMNAEITSTIEGLDDPNVAVADLSDAYTPNGTNHRWCSRDPWAYGLSIFHLTDPASFESQAPFHPTPRGQRSIAEHVIPTVRSLFQ